LTWVAVRWPSFAVGFGIVGDAIVAVLGGWDARMRRDVI
jgi:hypothetical protein